ncbi:LppP/LprE family lipoprotein [Rothia aeria]|nr:LppP/LprE family lipoprotein [Rothia aeria]MDK7676364.1 LppP/LprE family lipoprotein [Rothia aeria]QQT88801.1 LppP/LprE family lipoprotein [Rothia aeria]
MRPTVTKIAIPAAVAALTLTACGNPFGASTESKSTKSSGSSSSSSAQVSHSSSSSAASAATSSASPSSSPSVVTVTATPEPTPSTVTVYASPDKSSSSPSSSSSSSGKAKAGAPTSGQQALEQNKSKLRGGYTWTMSLSDTSNYDANVELSWIVVGAQGGTDGPYHIMLFHYGEYLGTGTYDPLYGKPNVSRTAANQISATHSADKASFTWDDSQGKIVMSGHLPTVNG